MGYKQVLGMGSLLLIGFNAFYSYFRENILLSLCLEPLLLPEKLLSHGFMIRSQFL